MPPVNSIRRNSLTSTIGCSTRLSTMVNARAEAAATPKALRMPVEPQPRS